MSTWDDPDTIDVDSDAIPPNHPTPRPKRPKPGVYDVEFRLRMRRIRMRAEGLLPWR